ncbi:MAG: butyrate kinase [Clostridia bacterium]|nr:butyrate kinase [Clostridia bacterium]
MGAPKKILVINMGSTSSKMAYFEDDKKVAERSWEHSVEELDRAKTVEEKCDMRRRLLEQFLAENGLNVAEMDAIATRGSGGSGRYRSGAYLVTPELAADCKRGMGHQGLLTSTVIADEWSQKYGVPAYLYDVVPVDELQDISRITGHPAITRGGGTHTLNTRAMAMAVAEEIGVPYSEGTFIVTHMGGGVSSNLHVKGRMIDIVSADEGAMTPDRMGKVPCGSLTAMCYRTPKEEFYKQKKGLIGNLGTNDCKEIEQRIANGDERAELVYHAMALQVGKDIASLAAVVGGKVDAIVLTGGIAHSKMMTGWIKEYIGFIAPVHVKGGAKEVEALAGGVLRVLNGQEKVNDYEEVKRSANR